MSILNGEVMHQLSRDELIHILESIHGQKDVFVDSSLMKPLDRVAGASVLRDHGVDKMYRLERGSPVSKDKHCVYIAHSSIAITRLICDHVNANRALAAVQFHAIFVPKIMQVSRIVMEEEGVAGLVDLHAYSLGFVALDADLWSLELPDFFRSVFLDEDTSLVEPVARALWQLQGICGQIPQMYAQGRAAQQVLSLLDLYSTDLDPVRFPEPEIGRLLLVDRTTDCVSVLLTQLTYGGLTHETFPVRSGVVELGPDVTGSQKSVKMMLHARDEVYKEIRDQHISGVFPLLRQRAKQLQSQHTSRQEMSVADMKQFIQGELRATQAQHRSLAVHIGMCEVIAGRRSRDSWWRLDEQLRTEHSLVDAGADSRDCLVYIEQWLALQRPALGALRLLCLYSISQDGLSPREYQSLSTQFMHSYGFQHLLTLLNLSRLGLFVQREVGRQTTAGGIGGGSWQAVQQVAQRVALQVGTGVAGSIGSSSAGQFRSVCRKLQLVPPDDSSSGCQQLRAPTDPSYVFSGGYVPVCCRLLEAAVRDDGWQQLEPVLRLLPGAAASRRQLPSTSRPTTAAPRVVCVMLLGGATMAELAALQLVARQLDHRLILLTTAVINGDSLLQSVTL